MCMVPVSCVCGFTFLFVRYCLVSGSGFEVSLLYSCWLCSMDVGTKAPSTIDVEPEVSLHAFPFASEQVPVLIQECFGVSFEQCGTVALFGKHREHALSPPNECAPLRADACTPVQV